MGRNKKHSIGSIPFDSAACREGGPGVHLMIYTALISPLEGYFFILFTGSIERIWFRLVPSLGYRAGAARRGVRKAGGRTKQHMHANIRGCAMECFGLLFGASCAVLHATASASSATYYAGGHSRCGGYLRARLAHQVVVKPKECVRRCAKRTVECVAALRRTAHRTVCCAPHC